LHFYNLNVLVMIICKMDSSSFLQAPTQVTCAYFQRASKLASAPSSSAAAFPLQRAAHYRAVSEFVNTSLQGLFELRFKPIQFVTAELFLPKRAAHYAALS
jgi:hypothetical protein